jgi:hypothetical protein
MRTTKEIKRPVGSGANVRCVWKVNGRDVLHPEYFLQKSLLYFSSLCRLRPSKYLVRGTVNAFESLSLSLNVLPVIQVRT